ncbi:MAG: hypothetical protein IPF83_04385 [Rhodanobacteraceae bacterium]|nr:hypothetical protein [Rhodanobacteraceae bacterium]
MKLKLDDQGHAVLQNGMPVYIHDDGKESPSTPLLPPRRLGPQCRSSHQPRAR